MRGRHFARSIRIVIALVLTSLSLPRIGNAAGEERQPAGISVNVAVIPMDAARSQFQCTASIVDLGDGSVLMAPRLQLLAGREGMATSSPRTGIQVLFSIRVEEGGTRASYSVEHSRDGMVLAKQSGSISLAPGTAGS